MLLELNNFYHVLTRKQFLANRNHSSFYKNTRTKDGKKKIIKKKNKWKCVIRFTIKKVKKIKVGRDRLTTDFKNNYEWNSIKPELTDIFLHHASQLFAVVFLCARGIYWNKRVKKHHFQQRYHEDTVSNADVHLGHEQMLACRTINTIRT